MKLSDPRAAGRVRLDFFDPKATTTRTVQLGSETPGTGPSPIEDPAPSDAELETDPVTLDRGHVDLGPALVGKDLDFVVGDDTALHAPGRVNRSTDSVTLEVNRSAFTQRTEGMDLSQYPGLGDIFYLLPQTQKSSLVWPGFSTEHLDRTRFPDGLDVELQTVSAPAGGKWWARTPPAPPCRPRGGT